MIPTVTAFKLLKRNLTTGQMFSLIQPRNIDAVEYATGKITFPRSLWYPYGQSIEAYPLSSFLNTKPMWDFVVRENLKAVKTVEMFDPTPARVEAWIVELFFTVPIPEGFMNFPSMICSMGVRPKLLIGTL